MNRTLILTVLLAASFALSAKAQLISIQFGGNDYGDAALVQSGEGYFGSSGDKWNNFTSDSALEAGVSLVDSTGASTGATLTATGTTGTYYPDYQSIYQYSAYQAGNTGDDTLQSTNVYNLATSELGASSTLTLTLTGLADNANYSIFLLSVPDNWGREAAFSVNSGSTYISGTPSYDVGPLNQYTGPYESNGDGSAPTTLVANTNYVLLSGTTDSLGDLTIEGTSVSGDVNVNGLQLEEVAASPEPSTYSLMIFALIGGLIVFRIKRSSMI